MLGNMVMARPARAVLVAAAALSLTVGGSACGFLGGVDKAAVSERLQEEREIEKVPAGKRKDYADCLADVTLKYANEDDLKDYVDGKKAADDIRGMDSDEAAEALKKCAGKIGER